MADKCDPALKTSLRKDAALDGFHFVTFDAHRQRTLNGVDRDHQGAVAIARNQYAFESIERAAANAHTLSDFEKRMARPRNFAFDQVANRVDLVIGNRRTFAVRPHQTENSINTENSQSLNPVWDELCEHIAAE